MNAYIEVWQNVLATVLGWPQSRIDEFVARWQNDLDDKDSLFYHEDPAYYVTYELLPKHVLEGILSVDKNDWPTHDRWEIFQRVQYVINDNLNWYGALAGEPVPEVDWLKVKGEIEGVLAEYGETLPSGGAG
jgi:hypothetical protein